MTVSSFDHRRAYFMNNLRQKLQIRSFTSLDQRKTREPTKKIKISNDLKDDISKKNASFLPKIYSKNVNKKVDETSFLKKASVREKSKLTLENAASKSSSKNLDNRLTITSEIDFQKNIKYVLFNRRYLKMSDIYLHGDLRLLSESTSITAAKSRSDNHREANNHQVDIKDKQIKERFRKAVNKLLILLKLIKIHELSMKRVKTLTGNFMVYSLFDYILCIIFVSSI
jgi:hypothetical protein